MEGIDRDYTGRQIYSRFSRLIWRYKRMLFVGIGCGMLVGGAWVPVFNMVPLMLGWLQSPDVASGVDVPHANAVENVAVENGIENVVASAPDVPQKNKAGAWVGYAEDIASRIGVTILNDDGRPTWQFLLLAMMVLPIVVAVKAAATFFNHYALRWIGVHVVRDLRNDIFAHLQHQSLAFFGRVDVGKLMSRCTVDTTTVNNVISVSVADLCRMPFEVAASLAFVVWFAFTRDMLGLLLVAAVGFPLIIVPLVKIGRMVRKWAQMSLLRVATMSSRMHENFTGIRVVKAYHTEALETADFMERNHRYVKATMRSVRLSLFMDPVVQTVSFLLVSVFIVVCFAQKKTLADILPLMVPFLVVYKPIKQLSKIQASLEQGRAALTRIYSLLDLDTSLPENPNPVPKKTFDTAVVFDNVDFAYTPDAEKAVSGASFEIPKGRMVAVVGATGSGKTTLANLLARFYDPTAGRVLMDGVDVRDLSTPDLRKLVGVVTQETILFNTTVRDNIAYGTPKATQEQIESAARMANAHAFITAHPDGYDRMCGEKGFVLSGGERQRVAIARAILKNPPILILDEATSALDTVTERQVQEAITRLMAHRTVFAIAHRLSTIRQADLILVVEKGVIVERGTHDELLAQNGRYRGLCEMQQGETL